MTCAVLTKVHSNYAMHDEAIILRKALEDIRLIAASHGTKAPKHHEVDRIREQGPALDSIYHITTNALRKL